MKNKLMDIVLTLFYLIIIGFIIGAVLYFLHKKNEFYLHEENITIPLGSKYSVKPIAKDDVKGKLKYTYKSSNDKVATIDNNGQIIAVGSGSTIITVSTTKDNVNEFTVNVSEDDVYLIDFNPSELVLKEKEKYTLKPTINNEEKYSLDLNWSSSDSGIVSVDSRGNINANKVGIAYVTVSIKDTEFSSKVKITVLSNDKTKVAKDKTKKEVTPKKEETIVEEDSNEEGLNEEVNTHVNVKGVKIISNKKTLKIGEEFNLKYEVLPSNATNRKVTFSSNNKEVISVDSSGKIKALKAGTADISIKTNEGRFTDYVTIIVERDIIHVKSASMNKQNTSIIEGESERLSYTITPSNADNRKVTWKSSNINVATVDGNGLVTAQKEGTASISIVTDDGKITSSCTVFVTKKVIRVNSISLNKNSMNLKAGTTERLTHSLSPSDATNQKVSWSSSDESVASVSEDGIVSAKRGGTAKITVTTNDGNYNASCEVTVTEILVTELSLNKSNFQMEKGSTIQIGCSIQPSDATDKTITWSSSDTKIATVDQSGNVKGISYGMATITAKNKKSNKSKSVKIYVAPTNKLIDIRNSKYNVFQHNIGTLEGNYYKHMQNFAIVNIGKDSQIIYLSTVQTGCYSISSNPSLNADQKKNLGRTIIYRVAKNEISDPNRTNKMYLEGVGHGQALAVEPNSDIIWTNDDYYITESGGYYWGHHKGIMRIKFKKTNKGDSFSPIIRFKVKDSNGNDYNTPDPSKDADKNFMFIKYGSNFLVYDYNQFKSGKFVLIYKSVLSSKVPSKYSDGSSVYQQGLAIKGGFIYQLRGAPGKDAYIEAFNLLGESQFVKKLNTSGMGYSVAKSREPEGLQIYNNKLYVGTTKHRSETDSASLFDIVYYQQ